MVPTAPCRSPHRAALAVPLLAVACSSSPSAPPAPPSASASSATSAAPSNAPSAAAPAGVFTDITAAAGIDFKTHLPGADLHTLVDSVGSGAAFADLDGDGFLDLILCGGARSPDAKTAADAPEPTRLYHNLGNGRFEDATKKAGLEDITAVAVTAADFDNDGQRDLYFVDNGANRLFRNKGDGTFEDVTRHAGVGDRGFGVGAVFFDMDADGDLDLYVVNYVVWDPRQTPFFAPDGYPGPMAYAAAPDVLYRNRGDGTFEDVTAAAGIVDVAGRGMSVAAFDADEDGDTDLYVANDSTENALYLNDGHGVFTERGLVSGVATGANGESAGSMAIDVGDVDLDGHLDVTVSDTAYGALYHFVRPGVFADVVMASGLAPLKGQYVSWGQNLIDFDNDGALDLLVATGGLRHVVPWESLLLRNRGDGHFEDARAAAGPYFQTRVVGRGSIVGDLDNDGDLDALITSLGGPPVLLRNDSPPGAAWLTVDLVGQSGQHGRDPFGARLKVTAGGKTYVAEARCPTGYLGQSDPRVHFGLGTSGAKVDRLSIVWPDHHEQTLTDVPTRQLLRVVEGAP